MRTRQILPRDAGFEERSSGGVESTYAWVRLFTALTLSAIGSVGMWSVVVVLPAIQADFAVSRADASVAYSCAMIGFGLGGVLIGRLSDRFGIMWPMIGCTISLGVGYVAASMAQSIWQFAIIQGALICMLGGAVTFGPMMADISHWFDKRRGIAIAICASGNYLAGFIWSPVVQHLISTQGWRQTHFIVGVICLTTMLPLALLLYRRSPTHHVAAGGQATATGDNLRGFSPTLLTVLLLIAGVTCCVAMSTPQVHLVAYCGDLGYGAAHGAWMLSIMLGCGILSRLLSGWISDRIGGLRTLVLGSLLQTVALVFYVPFTGLNSLYIVSGLFGLFQGGLVPSYALIVREYFSPKEAGARVGIILMSTIWGMAIGGWMSGAIFDLTGSYTDAFVNGIFWNLFNLAIALWLLGRIGRPKAKRQQAEPLEEVTSIPAYGPRPAYRP